jgi:hypothetical protein
VEQVGKSAISSEIVEVADEMGNMYLTFNVGNEVYGVEISNPKAFPRNQAQETTQATLM